ncbi:MAG: hypothetical protein ACK54X_12090 [Burkholderiales bacterium]|jgi:hypothetical protein
MVLLTPSGRGRRTALALCAALAATAAPARPPASIVELQPARADARVPVSGAAGLVAARWVDLNPAAHAWFLLTLEAPNGAVASRWHLENADPSGQRVRLEPGDGGAIAIEWADGALRCAPWSGGRASALERARTSGLSFAPLCDGRLFLRNPVRGHRSALEASTEFLRDHVPGGERVVGAVKSEVFRDAYVERGRVAPADAAAPGALPPAADGAPAPLPLRPEYAGRSVIADGLGIDVVHDASGALPLGRWLPAAGAPGVHVAVVLPAAVPDPPEASGWRPDPVEAKALAFLVAFDLSRLELGFSLGTEHPRLGWSARVPPAMRDAAMPGPDGIGDAAPLVRTGMVAPSRRARVVATFTGGFKREHGAFRYGVLAERNGGSHYGFVEQGVVFSRLVAGLSTLFVLDDGTLGMKTWSEADDALLPRIRDARQNGVPLVETPDGAARPSIGALVGRWGPGNWSGSADEQLRSLRAGACLIEAEGRRHLVYGWFSSAVPATMAQVFRSAGCRHAMHLDMNALEHTYLAVYVRDDGRLRIRHLVRGMAQLDVPGQDGPVPRFLGFPDDRDFFHVRRREAAR